MTARQVSMAVEVYYLIVIAESHMLLIAFGVWRNISISATLSLENV